MQNSSAYLLTLVLTLIISSDAYATGRYLWKVLPNRADARISGLEAPKASMPDLASIREEFVTLSQMSRDWPELLAELVSDTIILNAENATSALASSKKYIESMRAITTAGISEQESQASAQYKHTRAMLYLSLARSACSRALTALLAYPATPAPLLSRLTELSAAIELLLLSPLDAPEDHRL